MRRAFKIIIIILLPLVSFIFLSMKIKETEIIIDSQLTFAEATKETKAPKDVIDSMVLLEVKYFLSLIHI